MNKSRNADALGITQYRVRGIAADTYGCRIGFELFKNALAHLQKTFDGV